MNFNLCLATADGDQLSQAAANPSDFASMPVVWSSWASSHPINLVCWNDTWLCSGLDSCN